MAEGKTLRPLSRYLEFGVRLHWEDFSQLTAALLLIYLPIAALALYIHPSLKAFVEPANRVMPLIPRMLFSQAVLRVLQIFIFVLFILRLEAQRRGEGNIWDVAGALSRLATVAAVDLAYTFGLQALAVLILWLSLAVAGIFLGKSLLSVLLAVSVTGFLVIAPAVRYYFCSLAAFLHGTGFAASFRRAGAVSLGGEGLVIMLVLTYVPVWLMVGIIFHALFGWGTFGQLMVQAAVMVTSISYFFAGYRLYLDLASGESQSLVAGGGGEAHPSASPAGADPEGEEPGEDRRRAG